MLSKLYRFCIPKQRKPDVYRANIINAALVRGVGEIIVHNHNFPEWLFDRWFHIKGGVRGIFKDISGRMLARPGSGRSCQNCQVVSGRR